MNIFVEYFKLIDLLALAALAALVRRVSSNMSFNAGPRMPVWLASYFADGVFPSA